MKFQYDSPPSNSIFKRVGICKLLHPQTKGQIKQLKNFWTRRHLPQWFFSLGDCDRFSGMNATPGKPGALICLGNYATVIPTPIEGEGGGQNQAVEFHFFCLETLG